MRAAQAGGCGLIVYARQEGNALGEVAKFLVHNARAKSQQAAPRPLFPPPPLLSPPGSLPRSTRRPAARKEAARTALAGGVSPSPTPRPPPAAPLAAPQGSDVRQREEETERVTGAADVRLYELCADPLLWLGTSRRRLPDSD